MIRLPAGSRKTDLLLLLGAALMLIAAGLGLRDPWPADEPRFALIARDMVASGQWLIPQVGGDWYQDKPPLYFWLLALALSTGAGLQIAFLLPSLLAALATIALTYDLGRRLWSRETGLAAGLLLLFTLQFLIQARSAQIDMTLVLFTTAGVYGIARHLLAGADWRAYFLGGFAAGLGIITKGTGFLPLLLPFVYLILARFRFRLPSMEGAGWRWMLAPMAALLAIGCWLVPMLVTVAQSGDPALAAYRDEILFLQTVSRYAEPWGHHNPWYFYLVMVIPGLWLPGTALLPWLLPRWMTAWRERDPRPWLLLMWVVMVVLFFSMSPGKRGLYVFPALPAFALAAAPALTEIWRRRAVQWVGFGLALLLAAVAAAAYLYASVFDPARIAELQQQYGAISLAPLAVIALAIGVAAIVIGPRRGLMVWAVAIGIVLAIQGFWINPMIDESRSDRHLARRIESVIPRDMELGIVAYPESLLLQLRRPTTNFGHRRSRRREGDQELADALLWLNERPGRSLLLDGEYRRTSCLADVPAMALKSGEDPDWYVLTSPARGSCGLPGRASAARVYRPPGIRNRGSGNGS